MRSSRREGPTAASKNAARPAGAHGPHAQSCTGAIAPIRCGSESGFAVLAGPDANRFGDVVDEDLAVADLLGLRGDLDRLDDARDQRVGDDDLDLHLGHEVDDVSGAAIDLFASPGSA